MYYLMFCRFSFFWTSVVWVTFVLLTRAPLSSKETIVWSRLRSWKRYVYPTFKNWPQKIRENILFQLSIISAKSLFVQPINTFLSHLLLALWKCSVSRLYTVFEIPVLMFDCSASILLLEGMYSVFLMHSGHLSSKHRGVKF